MEPVITLAAGAIAQLAFNEFIKSSAGEAAKKLTGEALTKANELRQLIWAKLRGSDRAETALAEVEKTGTPEALAIALATILIRGWVEANLTQVTVLAARDPMMVIRDRRRPTDQGTGISSYN
ncbi:MAG: hypothetical protein ACP5RH_00230 [Leptodesmis sp.]|uniref:hypothetical protein n=1 Tax=Leptodesmis sp. TaxID=3100501 RepID=UPI003D0FA120